MTTHFFETLSGAIMRDNPSRQQPPKVIPTLAAAAFFASLTAASPATTAPTDAVCDSKSYPIQITVDKVKNSRGTIKLELYTADPEKKKSKGKKIARTRVKAVKGETRACLNAPGAGDYSVALYHDENDNRKFDQNFIGYPKEGFGFSTDPEIGLSRPDHEDILFSVSQPTTRIKISVIYM